MMKSLTIRRAVYGRTDRRTEMVNQGRAVSMLMFDINVMSASSRHYTDLR